MKAKVAPVVIINTLFGPEEQKHKCRTCCKTMDVKKFYVASNCDYRVRSQCKECWKKYNGRTKFSNVAMFEVK